MSFITKNMGKNMSFRLTRCRVTEARQGEANRQPAKRERSETKGTNCAPCTNCAPQIYFYRSSVLSFFVFCCLDWESFGECVLSFIFVTYFVFPLFSIFLLFACLPFLLYLSTLILFVTLLLSSSSSSPSIIHLYLFFSCH